MAPQPGVTYTWQFGDGATARGATARHTYWEENFPGVTSRTVRVTARNEQGCETQHEQVHQVRTTPQIAFKERNNFQLCPQNESVQDQIFHAVISNATQQPFLSDITDYVIDWHDGSGEIRYSPEQFPVRNPISYPGPGTYPIRIRAMAANGCEAVFEELFKVLEKPVAKFSYTVTPASGTQAARVRIRNESAGSSLLYWGISPLNTEANGSGESYTEDAVLEVKEAGVYSLYMVVSNGSCADTARQTLTVLPGAPALPDIITGLAEVCAGSNVTYKVPSVSGAAGYNWSVPDSWSIVSGQGTNQVTVIGGNTRGRIQVSAYNAFGQSESRHKDVSAITQPAKPVAISGTASVCAGSEVGYSVPVVSGVTGYHWSVPAGWAITSPQNAAQITVRVGAAGGILRVTAANSCGQSVAADLAVSVSHSISNNTVEGNQAICSGQQPAELVGSRPAGGDGAYTFMWESSTTSATEGFVAALGYNKGQNYTPYSLDRTTWFRRKAYSSTCEATSGAVIMAVVAAPEKTAIEQVAVTELRASVVGEHYEWRRGDVVLPVTTQAIPIDGAGSYTVRVVDKGSCFSPFSDALQVTITGLAEEAKAMGISIQPNPSKGRVTISTKEPLQQVTLLVVNSLGQVVFQRQLPLVRDAAELNLNHLHDGIYLLLIHTPNTQTRQKLLLQR